MLCGDRDVDASLKEIDRLDKAEERQSFQETFEQGPTIIYVPTRKETLSISKYLCQSGVKAAAYNASVCSRIHGAKFMLIICQVHRIVILWPLPTIQLKVSLF